MSAFSASAGCEQRRCNCDTCPLRARSSPAAAPRSRTSLGSTFPPHGRLALGTLGLFVEAILRTNPIPAVLRWFVGTGVDPFAVRDALLHSFETCIQCRGCEPACPSDVQFGHLMKRTRETLATNRQIAPRWQRLTCIALSRPRLLRTGSLLLALLQRLIPLPRRLGLPRRLPLRRSPLEASGTDVYLFTGCVMDAWQRHVHLAAKRVLEAAGFGVAPTGEAAPCCGAVARARWVGTRHAGTRTADDRGARRRSARTGRLCRMRWCDEGLRPPAGH